MTVDNEKESVWDYPRPPRIEPSVERVRVQFAGIWIADSQRAVRVLETSHPPTFYLPPNDVQMDYLVKVKDHSTFCEWKGRANYFDLVVGEHSSARAAWYYPDPTDDFHELKDFIAFYPNRVEACFVGEEQVQAQDGGFYGGWITSDIVGPFKGAAGTMGW